MSERVATLTNGDRVAVTAVETTFMSFDLLKGAGQMMALYELYQLCLNPDRRLFGNTGQTLHGVGLLLSYNPATKQAVVHDSFRSVVLAAMEDLGGGRLRIAAEARNIIREINTVE